jgi:hypothetical protein
MVFIEEELFNYMRKNLTLYERLPTDFIGTESRYHLLNGNFFSIREPT